jgi:hypothetical protein
VAHDDEHDEGSTGWSLPGSLGSDDDTGVAEVECPYCGEVVELTLDPDGGATQDYVEDCEVGCRPWQGHVAYGTGGSVEVRVEQAS